MQSNLSLLMERYPEIGFLLHCLPITAFTMFVDEEGKLNAKKGDFCLHSTISKEIEEWKKTIDLEEIDLLYIFGVGLGYYYDSLKEWLDHKKGRTLVFLEEDLGVIAALLKRKEASDLLSDPRVHLRFVSHPKEWPLKIESLAKEFISDKMLCTSLMAYRKKYGRRFKTYELKLMRATASLHALLSESLHAHKIFANLYPNFKKIPNAFFANQFAGKFSGVPAIICGAGPSLKGAIPTLQQLENRALIIAGGSSMAALSRHGIEPHLAMALDPNSEEYERLRPSTTFETPILYANRVLPSIFATCNGPHGYMRSETGGIAELWLEEKLGIEGDPIGPDLGREAFSVTTLATAYAYALGCNPIILVGVDLAYTGMQRYAEGVLETANQITLSSAARETRLTERLLKRKDRQGNPVHTLLKWVMESSCLSQYAKAHPETLFLNATEGGIGFKDISYQPLHEIAAAYCSHQFNLRGKIHALSQQSRFTIDKNTIDLLFHDLEESFKRGEHIATEILKETTGRLALLEMDFMEEPAFSCCLQALGPALDQLLHRYYDASEHHHIKWNQIKSTIHNYLTILK